MTQSWRTKPLGALTASEIAAVLERIADEAPEDTALEMALRRELTRAAREEWMFDDDAEAARTAARISSEARGKDRLVA